MGNPTRTTSMLSEACSTGKPVYVVGAERCAWKFSDFQKTLHERRAVRPLTGKEDMSEKWSYSPLNDNEEAAKRVIQDLAELGWKFSHEQVFQKSSSAIKGKAPLLGFANHHTGSGGYKRGISVLDFLLRLAAIVAALAAAATMGTSDETLPFFTQFLQFEASYDDLPTFQYFVIAIALVAAYLVLSLPISVVTIVRPLAVAPRLLLLVLDTAALILSTSAASAAAAIVYLAHNGNQSTNWLAICQQFGDFCQKTSGSVVSAFVSVIFLAFLVVISGVSLKRP